MIMFDQRASGTANSWVFITNWILAYGALFICKTTPYMAHGEVLRWDDMCVMNWLGDDQFDAWIAVGGMAFAWEGKTDYVGNLPGNFKVYDRDALRMTTWMASMSHG